MKSKIIYIDDTISGAMQWYEHVSHIKDLDTMIQMDLTNRNYDDEVDINDNEKINESNIMLLKNSDNMMPFFNKKFWSIRKQLFYANNSILGLWIKGLCDVAYQE